MGVRFNKWLARPTTLHFLRQLIGPEPVAVRTRPSHRNISPKSHTRCYSAAQPVTSRHSLTGDARQARTTHDAAVAAAIETFHEQRERVAQELGLRILRKDDDGRVNHHMGPTPSSTSYSDILYSEARVRDLSKARGLLIDEPINHANLEAWCKILEYRQRTDGFAGVMDVWEGMRKRNIDLPVDGNHADALWTTFLHAAIIYQPDEPHERLLQELLTHAKDLKASGFGHYRPFHNILVGRCLRLVSGDDGKAPRSKKSGPEHVFHRAACKAGLCEAGSLPFLVMDVLRSGKTQTALARWQKLYRHDKNYYDNENLGMYDLCMPLVLLHSTDDAANVISWHNFFVKHKDMPSPELARNPSIQYLMGTGDPSGMPARDPLNCFQLKEFTAILAKGRGDAQPSTSPILSRAAMSGLVGEVHGIKPKAISDKFCARMFATHAFSLETSIRGLALLGTESLGPVALRELAIRADSLETLSDRLADVKNAGIAISHSTYAHILETVVANSHYDLFQTLLASDQHPESYDDEYTQETLLANFLQDEDLLSAHITLIGLSRGDPAKASRAWNRLLQHYAKTQNYKEVARIFDHLCSEQLLVTTRSLNFMMKYLLATRAPGKKPMKPLDPQHAGNAFSNLVVNAHMYAASLGQVILADRWIELLKRYGMSGHIDGVERLASWLAKRYLRRVETNDHVRRNGLLLPTIPDKSRQAKIFNPVMLRAMIVWGFRYAGIRNRLRPTLDLSTEDLHEQWSEETSRIASGAPTAPSWTRGIALVSHLKSMGVYVRTKDVRHAVVGILWTIFGPAVSKRNINLDLIRRNEMTIMDYVKDANAAWHQPLFEIPPDSEDSNTETRVLRAVFGSERLADQKTGDWVDIEAWAAAKEEGMWQEPLPNLPDRYEAWSKAPFRFKDNFDTISQRQFANRKQDPFRARDRSTEQRDAATLAPVNHPRSPQPAAQLTNWRPLPSQPDTLE